MTKDIRKEQMVLLRFEKQIAGLAATLAVGATAVKAADSKFQANVGVEAYTEIQTALMNLATVTGQAHENLSTKAVEIGAIMHHAEGTPKSDPPMVVAALLGLG